MMLVSLIKKSIRRIFSILGYEVTKKASAQTKTTPGARPVGNMMSLLEDLRSRGLDCKQILDVGANESSWSQMAKRIFNTAGFYLLEPQIEMKNYLEAFCFNYSDSKYKLAGAGSQRGSMTLTVWDDLKGSSLLPMANDDLKRAGKQRNIDIITIDDLIISGELDVPELVKMDIQGFELEALKGASLILGKSEVFILEVSLFIFENDMPSFYEVISFMNNCGYVVYDFPGFLRRPFDGALGQCDICFVKKDGFLRKSNNWA